MATDGRLLHDLVVDVLLRLPVNSLFRCRCVCRRWNAAITDPHFLKSHNSLHKQRPIIFSSIFSRSQSTYSLSSTNRGMEVIRKLELPLSFAAVTTFLDFVCLKNYNGTCIYLYNPNNGDIKLLPRWSSNSFFYLDLVVGFGYEASARKFKVVRVSSNRRCEIFTLGDSSWRLSDSAPFRLHDRSPVLVGGVLYFLPRLDIFKIACFDLETEKWSKISLPQVLKDTRFWASTILNLRIMELGGFFCVAHAFEGSLDIWMLKDKNEGLWRKEITIYHKHFMHSVVPLAIENDGRILIYIDGAEELHRYCPVKRTWDQGVKLQDSPLMKIAHLSARTH